MQLPKFGTPDQALSLLQTQWSQFLNPVISLPMLAQNTIKSQVLASGDTTINHGLGRALQGWFVIRKRAAADIYDKQDSNINTNQTLVLNSSAAVTVDLVVF